LRKFGSTKPNQADFKALVMKGFRFESGRRP